MAEGSFTEEEAAPLVEGVELVLTGPPPDAGVLVFEVVSKGNAHMCGLTSERAAYCWGLGLSGRLGDGTTVNRTVPTAVVGGHTFIDISAGGAHTCALDIDGHAYCWGSNEVGQLGNGTAAGEGGSGESAPIPVSGGRRFASIAPEPTTAVPSMPTVGPTAGAEPWRVTAPPSAVSIRRP